MRQAVVAFAQDVGAQFKHRFPFDACVEQYSHKFDCFKRLDAIFHRFFAWQFGGIALFPARCGSCRFCLRLLSKFRLPLYGCYQVADRRAACSGVAAGLEYHVEIVDIVLHHTVIYLCAWPLPLLRRDLCHI